MADDFLDYPKAQVSLGSGDLLDVQDVTLALTDNEKNVSTLRQNPAGSTGGARGAELSFKSAISKEGFERDYIANWKKRKVVQARLKLPGKVFPVTGRLTKPQITSNVDNWIEFSVSLLGRLDES